MPDDLLGFLLGCGCKKTCCCQKTPAPQAAPGGNLFQTKGKGSPPPVLPDDPPFIPSPPVWDTPQRPGLWAGGLGTPGGGDT